MKNYNSLISELDEESLEVISENCSEINSDNLIHIKSRFYKKTKSKGNFRLFKGLTIAASIGLILVGSINVNTAFAAKLLDIPVIGTITEWVSLNKIALYDEYREINIVIPTVEGLTDLEAQEQINLILEARSMAVYDKAIEASEQIESDSEAEGFITSMPEHVSQTYTMLKNDPEFLSFKVVTTQIKASAYESVFFYNIDLNKSKLLKLSDLFKSDAEYQKIINDEIISQMEYANAYEDTSYFVEEFETVDENTNFYIDEEYNLVIVFNEYEVAAGYMGMPEFTINTELMIDIVISDYLK